MRCLRALKLVTEKQGYSTLTNFMRNNRELLVKGIGSALFASTVEEANLPIYPLSLNIGIAKGYKNSDLKRVALGTYSTKKKTTKRKYNRKSKSQVIEKTETQSVEPSVTEVKSNFSIIGNLFKRKNQDTSDLIKF